MGNVKLTTVCCWAELKALGDIFGILGSSPEIFMQGGSIASISDGISSSDIDALISERVIAKHNHDFLDADRIRKKLLAQGIVLEDSREGTSWRRQ